jgi:hypothetical protein
MRRETPLRLEVSPTHSEMVSAAGGEEEEEALKFLHHITKSLEEELEAVGEAVARERYQAVQTDLCVLLQMAGRQKLCNLQTRHLRMAE